MIETDIYDDSPMSPNYKEEYDYELCFLCNGTMWNKEDDCKCDACEEGYIIIDKRDRKESRIDDLNDEFL